MRSVARSQATTSPPGALRSGPDAGAARRAPKSSSASLVACDYPEWKNSRRCQLTSSAHAPRVALAALLDDLVQGVLDDAVGACLLEPGRYHAHDVLIHDGHNVHPVGVGQRG